MIDCPMLRLLFGVRVGACLPSDFGDFIPKHIAVDWRNFIRGA